MIQLPPVLVDNVKAKDKEEIVLEGEDKKET